MLNKGKTISLFLVLPKLEYSSEVWSPSSKELKQRLEMVQGNAAGFATNSYSQRSSVTDMLGHLKWETLESRRTRRQLKLLHKMFTCQVALKPFDYFQIIPGINEILTPKRSCLNLLGLTVSNIHSIV